MIVEEAFDILLSRFRNDLKVESWRILERYVVLKLSSGACGVAYYPHDITPTVPKLRVRDPIAAARLALSRVAARRAIGVAALNALTWALKPIPEFKIGDPLDTLDVYGKRVAMVGYFKPLLRRFEHAENLKIIERKRMKGLYPPERAEEVLAEADIVLITGSCLIYGGLERYLMLSRNASKVIVLGPTSSMTPEPFFKRGADIVAGVKIERCGHLFKSRGRAADVLKAGVKVYFERIR